MAAIAKLMPTYKQHEMSDGCLHNCCDANDLHRRQNTHKDILNGYPQGALCMLFWSQNTHDNHQKRKQRHDERQRKPKIKMSAQTSKPPKSQEKLPEIHAIITSCVKTTRGKDTFY